MTHMTHEHLLGGCAPTPLAHYLKALGILRLLAKKDPDVTGRWQGDQFVLRTRLNWNELERFFLEEYRPTPIIAPWNGGSGFYPNDNKKGIDAIANSTTKRLLHYKEVISLSRSFVGARSESPKNDEKSEFLCSLRSILPDSSLQWFDAAIMLTTEKPDYPPLLGTGGNDGRLDFTNNFMQRLTELFSPDDGKAAPKASAWLIGALTGEAVNGLMAKAIGQFSPGNAGGPNATTGFNSDSLINPWDFVLMMEGALLFAGSTTRRLESYDTSVMSYPFTVRTTGSGTGCGNIMDESLSRAEIWLPLWRNEISINELQTLLAEGRVTVGRRLARDGLDFARAISGLGVDRGISDFQRYAFLMRSGKAYLATPFNRIQVNRNSKADLITHLDRSRWLENMRGFGRNKNAPGRHTQAVRQLEEGIIALTQGCNRPLLQNILINLGRIQRLCATSNKAREAIAPLPLLGAEWTLEADDRSHEFRLACALAGLEDMRMYLFPLKENNRKTGWDAGSPLAVWCGGDLVSNLLRILERRLIEARRNDDQKKPLAGNPPADLAAVTAFIRGETDDGRIAGLLAGLVNVDLPRHMPERNITSDKPPAAFGLLKPLFTPDAVLRKLNLIQPGAHLPLHQEVIALLRSGNRDQVSRAVAHAWQRLKIAGLKLPGYPSRPPDVVGVDGGRLAAALMIPITTGDTARISKSFATEQGAPPVRQDIP